MLTLILLRHAKAAPQGRGEDFDRDLTGKGKADAGRLGAYLANKRLMPDAALVSASARTTQTFEAVAAQGPRRPVAQFDEGLYNATASQICDLLRHVDPAVANLMIVGHNPGIAEAAIVLARDGDILDLGRLRNHFPPGAMALLTFDHGDWLDARASGGRLDLLLTPDDMVAPD